MKANTIYKSRVTSRSISSISLSRSNRRSWMTWSRYTHVASSRNWCLDIHRHYLNHLARILWVRIIKLWLRWIGYYLIPRIIIALLRNCISIRMINQARISIRISMSSPLEWQYWGRSFHRHSRVSRISKTMRVTSLDS